MKKTFSVLRTLLAWAGKGLLLLIVLMMIFGAISQYVSVRSEEEMYPAPGKLVTVDGLTMHILCMGTGRPTVLLEAGLGDFSIHLNPLMKQISAFTRVCAYDRPGMGWSDPLPGVHTAQETAELFHAVLGAAGENAPYLVAGHSLGGIYSKTFADLYRNEVAGMVLIDSAGENQNLRLPPDVLALDNQLLYLLWACRITTPFGLFRSMQFIEQITASEPLPPDQINMLNARMYTYHFCGAMIDAFASSARIESQDGISHRYGDMPLIILERGIGSDDLAKDMEELPRGITLEMLVQAEDVWHQIQLEHANMSTRGELIVAEKSEHYIYQTQPELVIESIRRVVEMVR